tara:strand:+ start:221 stop:499 length:279 start_codon:yes stop_codon:yes gene_type:complete
MLQLTDLPKDTAGHTSQIKRQAMQLTNSCKYSKSKRDATKALLTTLLEALKQQEQQDNPTVPVQEEKPVQSTTEAPKKQPAKRRATAKTKKV